MIVIRPMLQINIFVPKKQKDDKSMFEKDCKWFASLEGFYIDGMHQGK